MTQITAILDDDLAHRLDALATENNMSRSKQVSECLIEYFKPRMDNQDIQRLTDQVAYLSTIIQNKDDLIKAQQEQIGFLHLEFSKLIEMNKLLLLPAPAKKWFEFWR